MDVLTTTQLPTPVWHDDPAQTRRVEAVCRSYHEAKNTLDWYIAMRERIANKLALMSSRGIRRIVLYGAGDIAEVAYAILSQTKHIKLVRVVDDHRVGERFFRLTIQASQTLLQSEDYDGILITSVRSADEICYHAAALDIPLSYFHLLR